MPTIVSIELGGTGANTAAGARAALGAASVVDSNSSYGQANAAYSQANSAYTQANSAYTAANTAQTTAQNAYAAANNAVLKAGDTITGNLNVAATIISQNVLPNLNVTYNLGSSDKRFKDLYLSNSTIYLGDATITANGSKLVVPAIETSSGINLESQVSTSYSQANSAYTQSNSAYAQANAAYSQANDAYGQANTAYGQANTATTNAGNAYSQANSAYSQANSSYGQANAAYTQANSAYGQANTATTNAGNAYSQANNAYSQANSAYGQANSAYGAANTAQTTAQDAYNQANTATTNAGNAYNQANAAYLQANTAFTAANNSNLKLGGVISGSLNVTNDIIVGGNVYLQGNTTFINVATYQVNDSLMYIAANNILTDSIDIGFVGGKNTSGTFSHTGFARDATDGKYKLFDGLADSGHVGNVIDFANTTVATLVANIEASSILLSGNAVATNVSVSAAYGQANAAYTQANSSYSQANSAYSAANNRVLKAGDTMTGELVMSATTPSIRFIDTDNSADAYIQAPDGNLRLFADDNSEAANSFIGMYVDGTERLRIANTGNVGISTTSPGAKLDIVAAQGYGSYASIQTATNSTVFLTLRSSAEGGARMDFNNSITTLTSLQALAADVNTGSYNDGIMTFWTTKDATLTERMRIDYDGNVGIGTTSPGYKLDVDGNARFRGGSLYLGFPDTASAHINSYELMTFNVDVDNDDSDTRYFAWFKNGADGSGTELMRLTESGNLGIGTTSPSSKLTITNTNTTTASYGVSANSAVNITIPNVTGALGQIVFTNDAATSFGYGAIGMVMTSGTGVGLGDMFFATKSVGTDAASTERMRITSGGNVGIGTTSPGARLHVQLEAAAETDIARFRVTNGANNHFLDIGADEPNKLIVFDSTGSAAGGYVFRGGGSPRVVIDASGNVGIGTTNPGYLLQVTNSANTAKVYVSGPSVTTAGTPGASIFIRDTTAASGVAGRAGIHFSSSPGTDYTIGKYFDGTNSWFTVIDNSANQLLTISSGGNVGIGTTNPATKLHIEEASAPTIRINATTSGGGAGSLQFYNQGTQKFNLTTIANTNDFALYNNGGTNSYNLYIKHSDGNVGIGTTNPAYKLDVTGAIRSTNEVYSTRNAGNTGFISLTSGSGSNMLPMLNGVSENNGLVGFYFIVNKSTNQSAVTGYSAGAFRFTTDFNQTSGLLFAVDNNYSNKFAIDYNGNVGIGTTSPQAILDVRGNIFAGNNGADGFIKLRGYNNANASISTNSGVSSNYNGLALNSNENNNNSLSNWIVDIGGIDNIGRSGTGDTFNVARKPSGGSVSTLFLINSSGNVGIGTTTPSGKLHLYNSGDSLLYIEGGAGYEAGIWFRENGVNKWEIYKRANPDDLNFYSSDLTASVMTLAAAGGVGIGTLTPGSYKLYVQGNQYLSGTLTEASSIVLKENIDPISNALEVVTKLVGVTYDRIDGSAKQRAGLIAEEVEQILPNIVQRDQDGNPSGIQYTNLIAYLVESIKELKSEIDILKRSKE